MMTDDKIEDVELEERTWIELDSRLEILLNKIKKNDPVRFKRVMMNLEQDHNDGGNNGGRTCCEGSGETQ